MKKIVTSVVALLVMGTMSFAQDAAKKTTTTTKKTETTAKEAKTEATPAGTEKKATQESCY